MNRQQLLERIRQKVYQLVVKKGFVSPLELLLEMELVSPMVVQEWRFGKVVFLEREVKGNLSQVNFILSKLREMARELGLKESHTVYMSWGKGKKQRLRFSKSGDILTERRYSTHFVKPKI